MRKHVLIGIAVAAVVALGASQDAVAGDKAAGAEIARGRYLVTIGGCNDCHTAGYPEQGGAVPESQWLTGVAVGYQGPWGTTYPANLRLVTSRLTEAQWVEHARQERLPPMPWFNLRAMTDADLRAMYRYVRSLGPKGDPAPSYAAPGAKVATPYIVFVPQNLPQTTAAR